MKNIVTNLAVDLTICEEFCHLWADCDPFLGKERLNSGLSLRAGDQGFLPANNIYEHEPRRLFFVGNKRKMGPKELPGCSVSPPTNCKYPGT